MLAENHTTVINPDELAKRAPPGANALIWSGREVHGIIADMIGTNSSFLVETTLSGRNHFRTVELARTAGFFIALHFVFVSNVQKSKKRVSLRVSAGGHDVPEVDQERRFGKSLSNLATLLPLTDEAFVYCNDFDLGHECIAEYLRGRCIRCEPTAPDWLPR